MSCFFYRYGQDFFSFYVTGALPDRRKLFNNVYINYIYTYNSYYYTIQSNSFWDRSRDRKNIVCVFNTANNHIVYWKEK